MIIVREKLIKYKNCLWVDIRSYEVENHLRRKAKALVIVGNQGMYLTPAKLLKKTIIDPELNQSKYNLNQTYFLYSYKWKPTITLTDEELKNISLD